MKVIQLSTYGNSGGAGRAAWRLNQALRETGCDSWLLGWHGSMKNGFIEARELPGGAPAKEICAKQSSLQEYLISQRQGHPDTLFSLTWPGADVSRLSALGKAQVLNLHWVAEFIGNQGLARLAGLGKPLVWTLHDERPLSGGCHYSFGCLGYLDSCADCPQLNSALRGLPAEDLAQKAMALEGAGICLVSPSRWLAGQAAQSALFKNARIECIPNGVDPMVFKPDSRARRRLCIPSNAATLLCVAERAEARKGFAELAAALRIIRESLGGTRLPDGREILVLSLGASVAKEINQVLPCLDFGFVAEEVRLAAIYASADIFVMPSLEDNLPNTVLEAQSAGAAVAGFSTGGVPDLVRPGENGLLAHKGEAEALARIILEILRAPGLARKLGLAGREAVLSGLTLEHQALRYMKLYEDLARQTRNPVKQSSPPSAPLLEALAARLEPEPLNKELQERLGIIAKAFALRDSGKPEEAAARLLARLELYPDDLELLRCLAAIRAAQGQTGEAVGLFRRCLELSPQSLEIWLNISDAFRYAKRYAEALAALEDLARLSPWHKGLGLKRGQVYIELGQRRAAAKLLVKEVRLHGCARSLELLRALKTQS